MDLKSYSTVNVTFPISFTTIYSCTSSQRAMDHETTVGSTVNLNKTRSLTDVTVARNHWSTSYYGITGEIICIGY